MSRLDSLVSWNSDWRDLRAVVFGLGVSGFSVADTLAELGASQLVIAEKAEPEHLDILDVLGVPYLVGDIAKGLSEQLVNHRPEVIITSPGIRPDNWLIQWALENDIAVWVDVDLAWRLRDKAAVTAGGPIAEWICITGTNGKTTTTQLTEAMLIAEGLRVAACGNIGTPILDCIRDPIGFDYLVVELSSFQLHYLGFISPIASAVLNIADDHLDWHGGLAAYSAAKGKIFQNTQLACVYNAQDQTTERLLEQAEVIEGARAIGFTLGIPARSQVGYVEDILCDRAFLENRAENALEVATFADLEQIGVLTSHLLANAAAATALARAVEVAPASIRQAIRNFKLDGHRIELVAAENGVRWFDDSKATNPHAAAASLKSFESVIWLVGGLLKGVDITELVERHKEKIKFAIVLGVDRQAVVAALSANGVDFAEIEVNESSAVMNQAVALAHSKATPGDTVLLAPAAASMDQFRDYADRGNQFSNAVRVTLGIGNHD